MRLLLGDCVEVMAALDAESADAVVTDPPYGLHFMGKSWDKFGGPIGVDHKTTSERSGSRHAGLYDHQRNPEFQTWFTEVSAECLRVLKPGGHLVAFGGSRTYHRMACAVEDAGFEIRDQLQWLYGSGFPKSHNLDGEHAGIGTALKPSHEPIVLARKPLVGTVAANVGEFGTGGLSIDDCRIPSDGEHKVAGTVTKRSTVVGDERKGASLGMYGAGASFTPTNHEGGRWPANVLLDPEAADMLDRQTGVLISGSRDGEYDGSGQNVYGEYGPIDTTLVGSSGGASRFFYCAKASTGERNAGLDHPCNHPTVKPIDLMRWLIRLVTPPEGTVLDPFLYRLVPATDYGNRNANTGPHSPYVVPEDALEWVCHPYSSCPNGGTS